MSIKYDNKVESEISNLAMFAVWGNVDGIVQGYPPFHNLG